MAKDVFKHYIILSSSYSTGTRIGLDIVDDTIASEKATEAVSKAYGGKHVPFSVHSMCTGSPDWDSVVRYDPYFDDVKMIDSVDRFVELVSCERYLKGTDVAKYILSKKECTHTRLEKLTYLCYAEYLCETGERLFDDKIYAFQYGPVVKSVYEKYRGSAEEDLGPEDDSRKLKTKVGMMAIRSRLMFAEDGISKTYSIDRTLKKYGHMTAKELVRMTHSEQAPWTHVKRTGWHDEIPDDLIKEYHRFEVPNRR